MRWHTADPVEYDVLKENAKANRNNLTEAESVFWEYAKSSGLGQKCRRQYVIGKYLVDFFFRKSMLIVELDGGYHLSEVQQMEDTIRQDWLESMGYKVLRFTNEQMLCDTENTIEDIKQNLKI